MDRKRNYIIIDDDDDAPVSKRRRTIVDEDALERSNSNLLQPDDQTQQPHQYQPPQPLDEDPQHHPQESLQSQSPPQQPQEFQSPPQQPQQFQSPPQQPQQIQSPPQQPQQIQSSPQQPQQIQSPPQQPQQFQSCSQQFQSCSQQSQSCSQQSQSCSQQFQSCPQQFQLSKQPQEFPPQIKCEPKNEQDKKSQSPQQTPQKFQPQKPEQFQSSQQQSEHFQSSPQQQQQIQSSPQQPQQFQLPPQQPQQFQSPPHQSEQFQSPPQQSEQFQSPQQQQQQFQSPPQQQQQIQSSPQQPQQIQSPPQQSEQFQSPQQQPQQFQSPQQQPQQFQSPPQQPQQIQSPQQQPTESPQIDRKRKTRTESSRKHITGLIGNDSISDGCIIIMKDEKRFVVYKKKLYPIEAHDLKGSLSVLNTEFIDPPSDLSQFFGNLVSDSKFSPSENKSLIIGHDSKYYLFDQTQGSEVKEIKSKFKKVGKETDWKIIINGEEKTKSTFSSNNNKEQKSPSEFKISELTAQIIRLQQQMQQMQHPPIHQQYPIPTQYPIPNFPPSFSPVQQIQSPYYNYQLPHNSIIIRRLSQNSGGHLVQIPDSFPKFLELAATKLGIRPAKVRCPVGLYAIGDLGFLKDYPTVFVTTEEEEKQFS